MTTAELSIRILFEDSHLVVLSKPAGLLSQGEKTGDTNLVDWLRGHFGRPYVGLVHRLDRNTSGLMVVAKRTKSARRLTEALVQGKLQRTYHALLSGKLDQPEQWTHWLVKNEKTNTVRAHAFSETDPKKNQPPRAQLAKLHVRPLGPTKILNSQASITPVTWVEFTLETGRSHQIRAQASAQNLPLVGDVKYGGPPLLNRPALHSARISFPHPMTGETMTYEDPLPQDLMKVS